MRKVHKGDHIYIILKCLNVDNRYTYYLCCNFIASLIFIKYLFNVMTFKASRGCFLTWLYCLLFAACEHISFLEAVASDCFRMLVVYK